MFSFPYHAYRFVTYLTGVFVHRAALAVLASTLEWSAIRRKAKHRFRSAMISVCQEQYFEVNLKQGPKNLELAAKWCKSWK